VRLRRNLSRLLALALGLTLSAVAGEIVVRASGDTSAVRRHFRPGIYALDPELGWGLLPDYRGAHVEFTFLAPTSTNAHGFRGPEWTGERLGAGLRVLALGDSCTFGRGVADDETYTSVLEALLRERGQDAAVFNVGVPGYDTSQELAVLERVGPIVRPHVILVGWLVNDALVSSAEAIAQHTVIEGHLVDDIDKFDDWKWRIEHRGINASALYRFLRVRLKRVKYAAGDRRGDMTRLSLEADDLCATQDALLRIRSLAEALGAEVLLVLFPHGDEVDNPDVSIAHHDLMATFAEQHGMEVVRVPQAWRSEGARPERFLDRDPVHPSPLGYRDLATAVARARVLGGAPAAERPAGN
jgi:lysophospholipase L1-like esterase